MMQRPAPLPHKLAVEGETYQRSSSSQKQRIMVLQQQPLREVSLCFQEHKTKKSHRKSKKRHSKKTRKDKHKRSCHFRGPPRPYDVLMGRGQGPANHPGNIRYRQIVIAHLPAYQRATRRRHKTEVVTRIRKQVQATGGYFLCLHHKTNQWYRVPDDAVQRKIGQTVRYMCKQEPTDEEEEDGASVKSTMSGSTSSNNSSMRSITRRSSKKEGSSRPAATTTRPHPRDFSSSLPTPRRRISSSPSLWCSSVMEDDDMIMPDNDVEANNNDNNNVLWVVSNHNGDTPGETLGENADPDDDDDSSFSSLASFSWDKEDGEEQQCRYDHVCTPFPNKDSFPRTRFPEHHQDHDEEDYQQQHEDDDNDDSWSQLTALEVKQGTEELMTLAALNPAAAASCFWDNHQTRRRRRVAEQVPSVAILAQQEGETRDSRCGVPLTAHSSCATDTKGAPDEEEEEEDPFIGLSLHLFPASAAPGEPTAEDEDHWMMSLEQEVENMLLSTPKLSMSGSVVAAAAGDTTSDGDSSCCSFW